MRVQQLPRQILGRLLRIGRLGHGTDDTFGLALLHVRLPRVRCLER